MRQLEPDSRSTIRRRQLTAIGLMAMLACSLAAQPHGDLNQDLKVDGDDIGLFVQTALDPNPDPQLVAAGDFTQDGQLDTADVPDFALALLGYGACCVNGTDCSNPLLQDDCAALGGTFLGAGVICSGAGATAGLTAFRPQHGAAYFPHTRTAVADNDEEDSQLGPGIRVHAPGDTDPSGEDDLIEVVVSISTADAQMRLVRENANLKVWTTRNKSAGTELTFVNDETGSLPFGPGATSLTLWIEWAAAVHGTATLDIQPLTCGATEDRLVFHTFRSIVMALGGEGQGTSVPVDPNHGAFVVGIALYNLGYDVHMYDEDNVSASGAGAVYNEVVNAIQNRSVDEVAIFGYSHGGGSTYDLSERLDLNRGSIGTFSIEYTAYIDGVSNGSDIDITQENRRPPSTAYHVNHYQTGSIVDFWLDGGRVPNSNPPSSGLNVETTPWGSGSTHYTVDDYVQVQDYMESNLLPRVSR